MTGIDRGTMDFFAAQAAAKRRTGVLVALFALAWALTIVLADLGITLALSAGDEGRAARHARYVELASRDDGADRFVGLLLPVAAAVSLIVVLGTGWHALRLGSDAGDAVARMVGGVPVDRGTTDPGERRAVNVLEEMAIAAALPVPRLYVLDAEPSINAFAAGTTPERAVVAVSRGALEALTRDELQGVLAHELSHVLHHDSRLNVRLISLVGGLTALSLVGRILLEVAGRGRPRSSRDRGNATLVFLAIGLVLLVAGAIGALFGRLIRLAVSRQREFLADAAAVQFTRNPAGLAGALTKIAERGSAISSPHAPEAAHFFFANGLGGLTAGLLSTHPPLEERIRRLRSGPLAALAGPPEAHPAAISATAAPSARPAARARIDLPAMPPDPAAAAPALAAIAPLAAAAPAAVGRLAPEHLARATVVLAAFPAALVDASRQPSGARALVLSLLLDPSPAVRAAQLAAIGDADLAREADRLRAVLEPVPATERLDLLDLALPALDALTAEQARALVRGLAALAAADGAITLYEWALERIVRRRLGPQLGAPRPAVRARALEQVEVEGLELLSALAWAGQREPEAAQGALDAGVRALGVASRWRLLPRDRIAPARLDAALARLDEAAPPLKARLLSAAAACAVADGRVTAAESQLLRAVAASLGLPMPGLVAPGGAAASAA